MNYLNIYNTIISTAKSQVRIKHNSIYYEKHHIIPKSLKGLNKKENLVLLTAKEHYTCHHLLTKIHPKSTHMINAFWMMNIHSSNQKRYTNARLYEKTRIQYSKIQRNEWLKNNPNNWIDNSGKNNPMYGVRRYGEENPFYGKQHTEEYKKHSSDRMLEYYSNNENVTKNSIWINNGKNSKRIKVTDLIPIGFTIGMLKLTCPHCNKIGGAQNMTRYHFDNCKSNI